jgi:CubicO group peptidase (beta-lactamase class C family)
VRARIVAWRESAFDDHATKFPARAIPNGAPVFELRPPPQEPPTELRTVRYPSTTGGSVAAPLDEFLAATGSTAFLVVRDDQLLVERYANGSAHDGIQTSFSVAKSFASTLVGIAAGEGRLAVDDPIVRHLPELRGRGADGVRIGHLLNMASGLAYDGGGAGGMPWQDDAKTYYDPDLRRLALTVRPAVEPNSRWQYNNYHPLLVGLILERATGQSVSAYMAERLWQPMGAEAPASQSLDSRRGGFEKMESGINARAADFARFGRLFLKDGAQNGRQVVPREWVQTATRPIAGSPARPGENGSIVSAYPRPAGCGIRSERWGRSRRRSSPGRARPWNRARRLHRRARLGRVLGGVRRPLASYVAAIPSRVVAATSA